VPDFRFDRISDIARSMKAVLNPEGAARGTAAPGVEEGEDHAEDTKNARERRSERKNARIKRREFLRALRSKIKGKKGELSRLKREAGAARVRAEGIEYKKRKKTLEQEIFQLERELLATKEGWAEGEPLTGALPDFLVIGGKKCGTSYLYHLLSLHPLVEPCAKKELHFFDAVFDEGVEWYRQCFPAPKWEDGRRTITGEATPYIANRFTPERVAVTVPQARLIALLRNPVERAYSDYQMEVSKGRGTRTFEEAIGLTDVAVRTKRARALGADGEASEHDDHVGPDERSSYLSRSVYVDQLLRWSAFFPREQLLVLKSEDFFERPNEILKTTFEYLGVPEWEPEASEILPKKRNKGTYEQGMSQATRRRLEEYFEPHNRRLYDFLGVDLGW
jgi:Sulfotransferase domain